MTLPVVFTANGPSGYNLTKSLRFRSSATSYLSRTFSVSSTNNKIMTYSGWIKRGAFGGTQVLIDGYDGSSSVEFQLYFDSTNAIQFSFGGSAANNLVTSALYRDPAAWYHIVLAIDTTQATAANRVKLYVNGSQITAFSTANYPAQNATSQFPNIGANNRIGSNWNNNSTTIFDGYMAEVNFIDGQALTPSSFGSTNALTGVWQPAKYTGTYGTNGFYLPFTNTTSTTTLGYDFSGNSNNWTTNNLSLTTGSTYDSMTDVPTLTSATAANYCVLNPLATNNALTAGTSVTNGNLTVSPTSSGNNNICVASMGMSYGSNKFYWEATYTTSSANGLYGLVNGDTPAWMVTNANSTVYTAAFNTSGLSAGDIVGFAYDATIGSLTTYKNNVSQGTTTGLTGTQQFAVGGTGSSVWNINFGQRPFAYTPPTGYVALNTFNLPTSTIVKGNTVMDATTYTGTGSAASITNTSSFKPDLVWLKVRNQAYGHALFDSIRGVGNGLQSNTTNAESAWGTSTLASFNSNGFGLGADTSYLIANSSGNTFVGWQWQAGQGTTSSNTDGSITSTVSVNATAGFSVVTWTGNGTNGATVGHGLGVAPSFVIVKNRSSATDWATYILPLTQAAGANASMFLNTTAGWTAQSTLFNSTAPTSSVITLGTSSTTNTNTNTYVAYCFTPISGYSAFGKYTGNGSTDGPFIYLGFRPKFIMWKRNDDVGNWVMIDTSRSPYNTVNLEINANSSAAETTTGSSNVEDILSNGYKIRNTGGSTNATGATYNYFAFAESPFKNALAR